MAARPFCGSPPETAGGSVPAPHPARSSKSTAIAPAARLLRIPPPGGHGVAFAQPMSEERKPRTHVDDTGRHPHYQSADLLVLERRESPGGRRGGIGRIPYRAREGEQRAQNAGMH